MGIQTDNTPKFTSPEERENDMEWYVSSMKKTLEIITQARAKTPENPHDISARWDYPKAAEHLQAFIDAFEGKRNFNDEMEKIEDLLQSKHILPNEDWMVERLHYRALGHSEAEIQQLLTQNKVAVIIPPK